MIYLTLSAIRSGCVYIIGVGITRDVNSIHVFLLDLQTTKRDRKDMTLVVVILYISCEISTTITQQMFYLIHFVTVRIPTVSCFVPSEEGKSEKLS